MLFCRVNSWIPSISNQDTINQFLSMVHTKIFDSEHKFMMNGYQWCKWTVKDLRKAVELNRKTEALFICCLMVNNDNALSETAIRSLSKETELLYLERIKNMKFLWIRLTLLRFAAKRILVFTVFPRSGSKYD